LKGLLGAAEPPAHGVNEVIVWAGERTLAHLPERDWLRPSHQPVLNGHLLQRLFWQRHTLAQLAARNCDLLFVPGGNYTGGFRPFVTMSRNLLPFSPVERRRFGLSWIHLRLVLLEHTQSKTFHNANGMIFLTRSARRCVQARTGTLPGEVAIVPHGVSSDFTRRPREQRPLSEYDEKHPFRWLYVSSIDPYKHQWNVVEAVGKLRRRGLPVALDLIGPAGPMREHPLERLESAIDKVDPEHRFVEHQGFVPHEDLAQQYHRADAFVFASSCENMPNTLLEAMSAGLPIASSDYGPMPEILGEDGGLYFDPERVDSIAEAMESLVGDERLRATCAERSYRRAGEFSWDRCAQETFGFLADVGERHMAQK
jgi:glycosyltransferase involved in cell wall biosynthesis